MRLSTLLLLWSTLSVSITTGQETASEIKGEAKANSATKAVQNSPLVDLLGPTLLSVEKMSNGTTVVKEELTMDALRRKKVIGVYFSAEDWCGPCQKFNPQLVAFYEKMNSRRGRKDEFEIVWVSRSRSIDGYANSLTLMPWAALPPDEAMQGRGESLSKKFGVKGIPSLILLDELGDVINKDARNMIPKDKAGIGFPWRNPLSSLVNMVVPRSARYLIRSQIQTAKKSVHALAQTFLDVAKRAGTQTTKQAVAA